MPYEAPTSGEESPKWTLSGNYGDIPGVLFTVTVTTVDGATGREDLGDACLQELLDALTIRPQISGIYAYKSTVADVHRVMIPSS